ncbi:MAG: TIGR04086 family membrane protein [Syntrophomonadaceae bacterium]|jgi:putative membrane protein (TIGR04086 family)|nr:TIGR04086 family membrane protein [Syntrophomonadaceae bacterium]
MKKFLLTELRALTKAVLLSLVLCLFAGTVVNLSSLPETLLAPLGKIIFILTLVTGSFYSSKSYGNKGLIRGINMGLLFFIALLLVNTALQNVSGNLTSLLWPLCQCLVFGGIGGVLGITFRK